MKSICLAFLIPILAGLSPVRATESCCHAQTPAELRPLPGQSLYQLDSTWLTDASTPIKLAALRGKPQVLVMFFGSCRYTCPLTLNDLRAIETALPADVRTNVGFTLVSFDSERDTPAALHQLRLDRGLTNSNWTLLHGSAEDVRELALLLGVQYRREADGNFSHSNLITLLDADGQIAFRQAGFNQPPDEIVNRLQSLPTARPTIP
ncbi:MAG: SCO family protein [Verrucomicrobiota bacterium]